MIQQSLKDRLAAREVIVGTFVKTPSPIVAEVLALTPLDCICLDAEHAPFDRGTLDTCILAARAGGMDSLVRIPSAAPEHILNALDCGATGVVVPHVRSAEQAEAIAKAAHYGNGGRGYAGSSRAAGYNTVAMAQHQQNSAARTVVIAQIEDPEAVDDIEAIARVSGVDALFIGRVDLTVAYGAESQDDPRVVAAVDRIVTAAVAADKPVGMFLARVEDVPHWRERGATLFLLGSDHTFLLAGARDLAARVKH
ncbi:HpcH/HpaI aldolase family protein [Terriglobus aquaticus]|uniref:HpcH/HpaI aldolase family protein n=1 Tax=Terriglobus aquaticus TaxID=940139 RepID=A0ABW9KJP0_9BACT|nr:aldolase/citrate lyase family protein [Terriglobus aquaticus]